ncbi:MAG: 23S rRNA (guanosine(2251)-2'-O)-methyltransferase RlmB, partial [Actinobacteria bacterium]|nr:23S rRNA (guanosine(2251)-2'-O)-methyltransferase RlmB [Actinomycetota bacterium]
KHRLQEILRITEEKKIPLKYLDRDQFRKLFSSSILSDSEYKTHDPAYFNHSEEFSAAQGVIAFVSGYNYSDMETALRTELKSGSIFVMLDEVTDVGNFGAILRICSAFNVDGVIVPKNRSVSPGRRASRISSGALEEVRIFSVTNLVNAIKMLKAGGCWIYGTTPGEDETEKVADAASTGFNFPVVLVFGNEQKGIGKLVKKNCDLLVKIVHTGKMQSLNVSVTVGIMLYILRQSEKGIKA